MSGCGPVYWEDTLLSQCLGSLHSGVEMGTGASCQGSLTKCLQEGRGSQKGGPEMD